MAEYREIIYSLLGGVMLAAFITNILYYFFYRSEVASLVISLVFLADLADRLVRAAAVGGVMSTGRAIFWLPVIALVMVTALLVYLVRLWYLIYTKDR